MQYKNLPKEKQQRLDPMIIGFNVTDMYAADHIKRVLKTFPGVFTGIGEFSIHKEFVPSKISGDVASLTDPALDRIFEFCAEIGLISIIHNDIDNPFPKPGKPNYVNWIPGLDKKTSRRNNYLGTSWSGKNYKTNRRYGSNISRKCLQIRHTIIFTLIFPGMKLLNGYDYNDKSLARTAEIIKKYPDRFLFGTDNVAPDKQEKQLNVYHLYDRLWKLVGEGVTYKVSKENYIRLFDDARIKVRAWEKANVKTN